MPLTTDLKTADVIVGFDIHNVCRRAEEAPGPTRNFTNNHKYPTGYLFVGMGKVYAALKHYGLNKNQNTALVLSAQENSEYRRKMYPDYKSGRKHREYPILEVTDPYGKIKEKIPNPVEDFMELLCCVPCVNLLMRKKLLETDDALASMVHQTKKVNKKARFVIVSNDRDLWSLMDDRVTCTSKPGQEFGIDDLRKTFQISDPRLLPLAKALFGDSSDKIKKAIAGVTEDNIPKGFLDKVVFTKTSNLAEDFARALAKNKKEVENSSLKKCIGKEEQIQELVNLIRLRKSLDLDMVAMKPDRKKMKTLLDWYQLKSLVASSDMMFNA
jgi:5'-3' exonuclease